MSKCPSRVGTQSMDARSSDYQHRLKSAPLENFKFSGSTDNCNVRKSAPKNLPTRSLANVLKRDHDEGLDFDIAFKDDNSLLYTKDSPSPNSSFFDSESRCLPISNSRFSTYSNNPFPHHQPFSPNHAMTNDSEQSSKSNSSSDLDVRDHDDNSISSVSNHSSSQSSVSQTVINNVDDVDDLDSYEKVIVVDAPGKSFLQAHDADHKVEIQAHDADHKIEIQSLSSNENVNENDFHSSSENDDENDSNDATNSPQHANLQNESFLDSSHTCLIPDNVCGSNSNFTPPSMEIKDIMNAIKVHRKTMGTMDAMYIPFAKLLMKLSRPGIPEYIYDDVAKDIQKYWNLASEEWSSNKSPTRHKVMDFLNKVVHPPKYRKMAQPSRKILRLNDGRKILVTVFNFKYYTALSYTDETLFHPDNFIFPNKNNPFEEPKYSNVPLGDINTGLFHEETYKILRTCKDPNKRLFLLPYLAFIDGTTVARDSVEPYTMVSGIFNHETRNQHRSWIVLGYVEPLHNAVGNVRKSKRKGKKHNQPSQNVKLEIYHQMLHLIQSDFRDLQKSGFYLDIPLPGGKIMENVLAVPVLQAVLSDTKGANGFTGRYNNHNANVLGLCRDCNIRTLDAAKSRHKCKFFEKEFMMSRTADQLKQLSFYSFKNSFHSMWMGYCDRYGIFGATPPELLHVFYLGIVEYLFEGFMDTLSLAMNDLLNKTSIDIVSELRTTHDGKLHNVDCYRFGINNPKTLVTGKEKMGRILLLYLCFLKPDFVGKLSTSKKRGTAATNGKPAKLPYTYSLKLVKKWFKLLEQTLAFDRWLRCDNHSRMYFFMDDDATNYPNNEPLAMFQVRRYMHDYSDLVKRNTGTKLLLTKFHHLLHFVHYTRIHGKMSNFDGSRPEAHGKKLTKDPGSRTNHQSQDLTYSIGLKHAIDKTYSQFCMVLCHRWKHYAEEYDIVDEWTPTERAISVMKERDIVEEEFLNDDSHSGDYEYPMLGGTRFELFYDNNAFDGDGTMKVQWNSRTQYHRMWPDHCLTKVEDLMYTNGNGDENQYLGFTELKTHNELKNTIVMYRAHPFYMSKSPWHSWVNVKWDNLDELWPAKIIMFLEDASSLGNGDDIQGPVAVIHSTKTSQTRSHGKVSKGNRLVGKINKTFEMEDQYRVISIDIIHSPVTVVEVEHWWHDPKARQHGTRTLKLFDDLEEYESDDSERPVRHDPIHVSSIEDDDTHLAAFYDKTLSQYLEDEKSYQERMRSLHPGNSTVQFQFNSSPHEDSSEDDEEIFNDF